MSDVFISYAREDRDKAERLAHACEQQNWAVWRDRVIPPGKTFAEVIGKELETAKAIVVLWSSSSVSSSWVRDEAQEAMNRGLLVPALIEKVTPPLGFRQLQTADLSDWDDSSTPPELESFLQAIGGLLNRPVSDLPSPAMHAVPSNPRMPLYVAAGVVLVLILGFAAYSFLSKPGPHSNQNQAGATNSGANNANQTGAGAQVCTDNARHSAVDRTSKGLMMIDPGGNQAAAVLQFNEAIRECPDYADAYFLRAQSFVALQQIEKALGDLKKVVAITTDADMRQQAEKFIADIERPRPTPTNPVGGSGNTNTSNANGSDNPANAGQVNEMFAADKPTRIAATTRLIIDKKQDRAAVRMSVKTALANPQNKSGVINTLVYLENVAPPILKENKVEIEKLLDVAKDNGPQTADHIKKVRDLLAN